MPRPDQTRQSILAALSSGPLTSAEVLARLNDVQPSTAKSTLSRMLADHEIYRYSLRLGKGQSIFSLKEPKPDAALLKRLYSAEFFGRPALVDLIDCLRTSHQLVTRSDVAKIAALQIGDKAAPSWTETAQLIESLEEIGLITREPLEPPIWSVNRSLLKSAHLSYGEMELRPAYVALREKVRYNVVAALVDFLRKNTFVSDAGTEFISSAASHVSFRLLPFDVVGFCFTRGIARQAQEESTHVPVVGDCLLEECNVHYAQGFMRRYNEALYVGRKLPPIPFVLAKSFETKAFKLLKKEGVLVWTQSQLLGQRAADAIERLLRIGEQIVGQQKLDPKLFAQLFEGFDEFKTIFGDLKGKLFELLVAYFYREKSQWTRFGWLVKDVSQQYDVDILAIQSPDVVFVECKGYQSGNVVDDGELKKHFTKRTPLARALLLKEEVAKIFKLSRFHAIVVTSGCFSAAPDLILRNDDITGSTRSDTTIDLWDRERLLSELKGAGRNELADIVTKYY